MKKYLLLITIVCYLAACNTATEVKTSEPAAVKSNITLPYTAGYTTDFTNNVSDSVLLTALNSYKYWESGDMAALRSTMADSTEFYGSDGFKFKGLSDSAIKVFSKYRDSLSSVKISPDVWLKNHSVKDGIDYVSVWYKEIDTHKTGKVDSAYYEDDNGFKNGKIFWLSSHKQVLK